MKGSLLPYQQQREQQKDRLIFMAVAGLSFSMFMIYLALAHNPADAKQFSNPEINFPAQAQLSTVMLYAPLSNISPTSKLAHHQFEKIYWPRSSVPAGAVRDFSELEGKFAKTHIPAGMPVRRAFLTDHNIRANTLDITMGMRAVSIAVNRTTVVGGWVNPGDRVDVVLVYRPDGKVTSKIIAANARVLSAGGNLEPRISRVRTRRIEIPDTVTLEVDPEKALIIRMCQQLGELTLLLRSPVTPVKEKPVKDVTENDVIKKKLPNQPRYSICGRMKIDDEDYAISCADNRVFKIRENQEKRSHS